MNYNKFKIPKQQKFPNHRYGWDYVVDILQSLHNEKSDILLDTTFEIKIIYEKNKYRNDFPIKTNWVGFSHLTPIKPPENKAIKFANLKDVFDESLIKLSLNTCKGLYVLSQYVKDHLQLELKLNIPIDVVYHPTELNVLKFDINNYNKSIIHCGFFLRKFNSFIKLNINHYNKKILYPNHLTKLAMNTAENDIYNSCNSIEIEHFKNIQTIKSLSNNDYDNLLAHNLIFVDFYDSSANNTIIECIARNNPIIAKKHPAVMEYLGSDYPLLYETLDEALVKINPVTIRQAHDYLYNKDKSFISKEYFLQSILESNIYKNL
jgi:hypothetical protein